MRRPLFLLLVCAIARAADFSIAFIPDMQNQTQYNTLLLNNMFHTIVNNAVTCTSPFCPASGQWNTQAVLSLGDNTNTACGGQMATARAGWDIVKTSGIPFLVTIGNHDYNSQDPVSRVTSCFDTQFGPTYYSGLSWYGGGYPEGSNANSYALVTIEGHQLLLMTLEFYPTAADITWATGVLGAHPGRQVILTTHAYVTPEDAVPHPHRVLDGDTYGPTSYSLGGSCCLNGPEMFAALVQAYDIVVVNGGHFLDGPYHAHISPQATNGAGHPVAELFSDYQNDINNSWFTIVKFRDSIGKLEVYTYSYNLGVFDPNFPMYTLDWTPPTVGGGLFPLPSPRKH